MRPLWFLGEFSFFFFGFVDAVKLVNKGLAFLFARVPGPGFLVQVALSRNLRVLEALNPTVKLTRNPFRIRYEI